MNPFVDKAEYDAASFDEWTWLIPSQADPLSLTVFGDLIFSNIHAIHLFSLTAAESFEIATVGEEIEWAIESIPERAP